MVILVLWSVCCTAQIMAENKPHHTDVGKAADPVGRPQPPTLGGHIAPATPAANVKPVLKDIILIFDGIVKYFTDCSVIVQVPDTRVSVMVSEHVRIAIRLRTTN